MCIDMCVTKFVLGTFPKGVLFMIIYHKPGPRPKKKRVKREGRERTKLRRELSIRAGERCETCDRYAPFYDEDGQFDLIKCGHTSHMKSGGSGGDDTVENTKYECFYCHDGKHRGKIKREK